MYFADVMDDMRALVRKLDAAKVSLHKIPYIQTLMARLGLCERFYIGNILDAMKVVNIEKEVERVYAAQRESEEEPQITNHWKLPFPLTYISFDIPGGVANAKDKEKHRTPKGSVICEEPDELAEADGFRWMLETLVYSMNWNIWIPSGYRVIYNRDSYGVESGSEPDKQIPFDIQEGVLEQSGYHQSAVIILSKLLNCKNIVTQTVEPSAGMNRKRIRRGQEPMMSYKVLKVRPIGRSGNGGQGSGDGLNALHLCRGHFKTFTEEKPLFGKYTGMYWWQSHARGNGERGFVKKRYELDPEDFTT